MCRQSDAQFVGGLLGWWIVFVVFVAVAVVVTVAICYALLRVIESWCELCVCLTVSCCVLLVVAVAVLCFCML